MTVLILTGSLKERFGGEELRNSAFDLFQSRKGDVKSEFFLT